MINFDSGDGIMEYGSTVAAGTRIQTALGGSSKYFTHLIQASYTPGGANHTVTCMRGTSRTTANGSLAAAGTVLQVNAQLTDGDGNAIAASDVVAVQLDNGRWHVSLVSSLDTPKTGITLTSAIPTGRTVPDGAKVVCYGVAGDTFHAKHQAVCLASQEKVIGSGAASICKALVSGEPLVLDSNNANYTGQFNYASCGFTNEG